MVMHGVIVYLVFEPDPQFWEHTFDTMTLVKLLTVLFYNLILFKINNLTLIRVLVSAFNANQLNHEIFWQNVGLIIIYS